MAAKFNQILSQIADLAHLKVRGDVVFGLFRGYLIVIRDFAQSGQFSLLVRYPRKEDTDRISQKLDQKALLKMVNAVGNLKIEPGILSLIVVPKWKTPELSQVKELLDTVINILSSNTPPYLCECEGCGDSQAEVILVKGVPELKCLRCTNRLRGKMHGVQAEWFAKNPNYKKGMTYAILAVFISSFAWALIAYVFQVFFFYAGFLIGMFVGFTLAYGTEKITSEVIVLAVGLTLFTVILGEVLYVAFLLAGEGISLGYLPDAFGIYISEFGGEFAGAIITGLIGAGIVSYNLYSQGRVQASEVDIVT